jgi:His/Glu/Gln/Arg/opine family amino acid ABC transporter permease subunit
VSFDPHVVSEVWPQILHGAWTTLLLFGASLVIGTAAGLVLALMRMSSVAPFVWFAAAFGWVFRGLPVLVVLFFTFYGLPALGLKLTPLQAGIIGLGVEAAAYKAEIIRSGLMAVDPGQTEAAEALGLSRRRYLRRIIIPQGIRIMIPPYISNAITLLKATSVASVITVTEMTGISNRLISSTFRPIEILTVLAAIYLVMSTLLVLLQQLLERRFAVRT